MKPSAMYDFPVNVTPRSWEVEKDVALYYQGIFEVSLNFYTSILFVPQFKRDPNHWPPVLPENMGKPQSEIEARLITIAMSKYAVTPNLSLKGQEEVIPPFDPQLENGVVFYVGDDEFEIFSYELSKIAEELTGIHDSRRVSELKHLEFVKFLLSRFVMSKHVYVEDLRMLGR
jgi:hypothetical protein